MVAAPLLIAIVTLWPTFTGSADTKKATELAKWTARKDFIEFCQSLDWEPAGCDLQPDSLGPPPVRRRQLPSWPSNDHTGSAFNLITFVALSVVISCLLVKKQQRRMRSLFEGSFHKLSRSRLGQQVFSTPLLSSLEVSDQDQTLQPTPTAHSTGLEAADHVPRRRVVGSRHKPQSPPLDAYDRTEDDNDIKLQPERHVDYLSHVWQEEDLHQSWRHVQSQRTNYENAARLENAAWRSWTKFRHNLPTISPTHINWSKDEDVTWLYGPLQPQPVALYELTDYSEWYKQKSARKIETTKRTATSKVEKADRQVTISGQLGLDEAANKTSRPNFQQGGNLKHGRHFGKSFTRNISIQPESKEVRFKVEFE
ncbi:protein phosphatase type 1 complex subunit Hex2/Reg1 [Trichoderma gamsii]|uniref:Protein phosphatase type 1 complex subunit Hex2/Reg1 n=1 Tax=Trichoderma gamsii TaxID=398673 RepID=A0A2P4ZR45_9HYPO|nr:protein phosphatase type 1 complex subunit Hex2/Reg1 [Trichoderma gamsii]PON26765.1 protein phosphatase type 1 complex subunit Hex2/Reg1 [Trichoderma gamsii]